MIFIFLPFVYDILHVFTVMVAREYRQHTFIHDRQEQNNGTSNSVLFYLCHCFSHLSNSPFHVCFAVLVLYTRFIVPLPFCPFLAQDVCRRLASRLSASSLREFLYDSFTVFHPAFCSPFDDTQGIDVCIPDIHKHSTVFIRFSFYSFAVYSFQNIRRYAAFPLSRLFFAFRFRHLHLRSFVHFVVTVPLPCLEHSFRAVVHFICCVFCAMPTTPQHAVAFISVNIFLSPFCAAG